MTVDRETEYEEHYGAESLLRALAPLEEVLRAFDRQTGWLPRTSLTAQNAFAYLVQPAWDDELGPSKTYLRKLVHRFVRSIDQDVEDEDLVRVIHESLTAGQVDLPNADESCHLSFHIPSKYLPDSKSNSSFDLRIRVFPQHNDVALKLWEAGACLAEYFLAFPQYVAGKSIVELGSGVGLTGIICAGCNAREVYFTDYSDAWLSNIKYNLDINRNWIRQQRSGGDFPHLTQGYLNWDECAKGDHSSTDHIFDRADILLAADVAYDVLVIPSLVETFCQFLLSASNTTSPKLCYLATTLRNKATHDALESELFACGISCQYVTRHVIEKLPDVFPVYFTQPRSEIRVCVLTLSS